MQYSRKIYDALSELYSNYIISENYVKKWVAIVAETIELHDTGLDTYRVLELAAGTGRFAERFISLLGERVEEYFATDLSFGMLNHRKARIGNVHFPRIVCDMRKLPVRKQFNIVISNFDSINYLVKENDLRDCFGEVKRILDNKGLFIFDYALIEVGNSYVAGNQGRDMESRSYKVVQKSEFDQSSRSIKNTFYFSDKLGLEPDFIEEHLESFFTIAELKTILSESGLKTLRVYNFIPHLGHNSNRAGAETDQRVQFVVTHS